tara:strand:- start:1120 stop:1674 length:555 start_codon:yes stop_codon:yes gene_type:complete
MKHIAQAAFIFLFIIGCNENSLPKPKAYLSLNYSEPAYQKIEHNCPYLFDLNESAKIIPQDNCWNKILYPKMKATVYLSYVPVENNIDSLLHDAYQMPVKHLGMAEEIPERIFQNTKNRVFGTLFRVVGEAASQVQFFLTDSTDHFLVGSLYFYTKPNYDSLMPAAKYVENDMMRLMESLEWKN